MSAKYPAWAVCPDCGCEVAATADLTKFRAHAAVAQRAGRVDAPCAISSNMAQAQLAAQHRREAGNRRKEYWAAKEAASAHTKLPAHLR